MRVQAGLCRDGLQAAREPQAARPRRRSGSVQASPMRAEPHAREWKTRFSEGLAFLAPVGLRVIDPDLKHGKRFLGFSAPALAPPRVAIRTTIDRPPQAPN